ncbi:MAG: hypothetical protein K6G23_06545 [Lachnospiraceae bacterium]|nr:hypothetical protein [Lachnospiraceae bacterium]
MNQEIQQTELESSLMDENVTLVSPELTSELIDTAKEVTGVTKADYEEETETAKEADSIIAGEAQVEATENKEAKPQKDVLTEEKLHQLKVWLFTENIRVENEKKRLQEMKDKFNLEREQFQQEMNTLNSTILTQRQKLKQEEQFFSKKMQILQNGFMELELDRKSMEREKATIQAERASLEKQRQERLMIETSEKDILFAGVGNSSFALKKRYRDLLKIYHPDNATGDQNVLLYITQEYERRSRQM